MASLKTVPGDIFAVPTHDKQGQQGFVLARTIELNGGVVIFEVFEKFYILPPDDLAKVDLAPDLLLINILDGDILYPTQSKTPKFCRNFS